MTRFEEALVFATRTHAEQKRKGAETPYVAHLLSVCGLAIENGADEDEAIAALLHDAVEDQGGAAMREQLRARFGERVASIVDGCTDAVTIPKPPWRERKEQYLRHLEEAGGSVHLISACDKLHNARAILADYRQVGEALWGRFTGGREGTLWYYRALADKYSHVVRDPRALPIIAELHRVIAELEMLARAR